MESAVLPPQIKEDAYGEPLARGTCMTLHLKEDSSL